MPTDNTRPQKQAAVDSLECKQEAISPVVVTATKQKQQNYKSSERSESDLPVTQVKMSTPFDTKLEHLLNNYFSAKGDTHDIRSHPTGVKSEKYQSKPKIKNKRNK